ncbi:hypothetical protein [Vibrio alginolyticus]|uniref:hypothetical protein n=1 Tax=Vibrio TaxID=662 RepID=UPI0006CA7DD1|nr:hypothetical protein [Vibrio alginolyticus]KPM98444.1 hypothetical protein AOG25_08345 [Vibrio alginolyticus]
MKKQNSFGLNTDTLLTNGKARPSKAIFGTIALVAHFILESKSNNPELIKLQEKLAGYESINMLNGDIVKLRSNELDSLIEALSRDFQVKTDFETKFIPNTEKTSFSSVEEFKIAFIRRIQEGQSPVLECIFLELLKIAFNEQSNKQGNNLLNLNYGQWVRHFSMTTGNTSCAAIDRAIEWASKESTILQNVVPVV